MRPSVLATLEGPAVEAEGLILMNPGGSKKGGSLRKMVHFNPGGDWNPDGPG